MRGFFLWNKNVTILLFTSFLYKKTVPSYGNDAKQPVFFY